MTDEEERNILVNGLLAADQIAEQGPKPGRVKRYRAGVMLARQICQRAPNDE